MAFQSTESFYQVSGEAIIAGPMARPSSFGENSPDSVLAEAGYYRLWVEVPAAPNEWYYRVLGEVTVNTSLQRCERVDSWERRSDTEIRQRQELYISDQIPVYSQTEVIMDPGKETDVIRVSAAATDKKRELDELSGVDLETFDPTLEVVPPQDGVDYSRLTVDIRYLTPWAGQPDNDLGFEAVLEVQGITTDDGAEARLYVIDAPSDSGAVLPFTQDTEDPKLWKVEARDGHKWSDPEAVCTVQLLWGAGSLPVSTKITCNGLHDRKANVCRYGVPAPARRSSQR